jgi:glycosyltransferase involved in cell wall biosynthesis
LKLKESLTDKTATLSDVPPISLIIPTRNEAETICECIQRAQQVFRDMDLAGEILVADNSSDETAAIANSCGAKVIKPQKLGYGNAYMAGFEQAGGIHRSHGR